MTINADAPITGHDLKAWGVSPGPLFGRLLAWAQELHAGGQTRDEIEADMRDHLVKTAKLVALMDENRRSQMVPLRDVSLPFAVHMDRGRTEDERDNYNAVVEAMAVIGRNPMVERMAVMPDACPVGGAGHIPVGGAVMSKAIHPGYHSADVCCSVAMTVFKDADPKDILDKVHAATRFGKGGRTDGRFRMSQMLVEQMRNNRFTSNLIDMGHAHLGTQGDGNHFAFVGRSRQTGEVCLVTHHGSRGVGAAIYKRGMEIAEKTRRELCPELEKAGAWIDPDTRDGEDYWQALQIAREWTLENHLAIHTAVPDAIRGFVWNEHNFVFRRSDGNFYHGKGATPATPYYGVTLVPLNMSEPVLVTEGLNKDAALGFSPHGAGRIRSRTAHLRMLGFERDMSHPDGLTVEDVFAQEVGQLDVRSYCGIPDLTELPSAYKDAAEVTRQMEAFGLAKVIDEIVPYGCIMAGDVDAFWRNKKKEVKA